MKPLICRKIVESSKINPDLEKVLSTAFIAECREKRFIYGNKSNWSYYIGALKDGENNNAVVINPKYRDVDFYTLFRYAVIPKRQRTETYIREFLSIFRYLSFSGGRPRDISCEEDDLLFIEDFIKAFRRTVLRSSMAKESEEIRKLLKTFDKCFRGKEIAVIPQLVIDTSQLFELYVYGILVRKFPKDCLLYQEKHGDSTPDYVLCGEDEYPGFIADAKYLSPATRIREKDIRNMKKYSNDSHFQRLTKCERNEKPKCYFFCAAKNGKSAATIISSPLEEMSTRMRGYGDYPFYRVSVSIPKK